MEESTSNMQHYKRPKHVDWIGEIILNNLKENEANLTSEAVVAPESANPLPSKELKITIDEIKLQDENFTGDSRIQSLSRIVTGKINYFINGGKEDERNAYWFMKLPNLFEPHRELSQMMDAPRREIAFYTEMLPRLRNWLIEHPPSKPIEFQVPTCYYGKYNRQFDSNPDLDIITHLDDCESLLVLEDMRASGYDKKGVCRGLKVNEAMAAIDEIVKFHVTSWAIQEIEGKKLNWEHLYKFQDLTVFYGNLLESCYSPLKEFLEKSEHPQASVIASKLEAIQPHLSNLFSSFLAPATLTMPSTLVHMDLWSENIVFRVNSVDKGNDNPFEEELDCCLLDWQLVTYGPPTHDLALLIVLSMDPESRRENCGLLLKYYYEKFRTTASYFKLEVKFDFETLMHQFKRSCVLALLMALASIDVVLMRETTQDRLTEALYDLIEQQLI